VTGPADNGAGSRGRVIGSVLPSRVSAGDDTFQENLRLNQKLTEELAAAMRDASAGGGPDKIERHRARGKLLARERIDLLLDVDSAFLELSALAAWGSELDLGGAVVTGIGTVSGVECLISASDPTIKGGSLNPYSLRKVLRGLEIARENRLPYISLIESGGADLRTQGETFILGGRYFREITSLSKAGVPTIAVVFGSSTAGGAYVPGMSDYTVLIRERSKVFLGGPPLVKMATGEISDEETLGGAEMHARESGLADYLAADELQALQMCRGIVTHLNWRKRGPGPTQPADPPVYDAEELLGVVSPDPRRPFDAREVIARFVDGSRFEEFKPLYGINLVCGWASVCGFPIGILGNNGVIFSAEAEKGAQFIQLCDRIGSPLLFMQNITGFMVGAQYERGGIIKDGAKLINAVANCEVPFVTLMIGASYGAGNYGMGGRAYSPRFLFTYPSHRIAVMGASQLAGVMSIVAEAAARNRGQEWTEEEGARLRLGYKQQIDAESSAFYATGRGWDDGIIDPRDTRVVLGLAFSAVHSAPVSAGASYGVFRM
jgi:acetyl-CoA carboxylase carboxyltransferase component